jgi:paraquat-inducible protein B
MSKQKIKSEQTVHAGANARLIGAFMLGAIALIVMVFLVFGSGNFFRDKSKYAIYFRGSVDGLNAGAPVKIRGVQVGSVTEINPIMHENGEFLVEVIIETVGGTIQQAEGVTDKKLNNLDTMINRGLRAQLQSQSFIVAQKMIIIDYFPGTDTIFAHLNKHFKEIPSIPTKSEELEQSIGKVVKQVGEIPFTDISKSMLNTFNSIDTFFKSTKLQPALDNISKNADAIGVLATRVDSIGLTISSGVNTATTAAATSLKHVDDLILRLENLSIENQYLIKENLEQLSSETRSMKSLMNYLQEHPSDILYGK